MTAAVVAGAAAAAAVGLVSGDLGAGRRRLAGTVGWLGGRRRPRRGWHATGAIMLVVLAFGLQRGFILAAVATTAAGLVARARARRLRAHARIAVVELVRAVAAELRSGRAPGAAFVAAVESAPALLRAALAPVAAVALDGDADDLAIAISAAVATSPAFEGLSRLVACWRVSASSGAMLGPAIDRVADALQDDIDLARTLDASLAGPRATMRLLACLPVVGLLLGVAIGARPVAYLVGSPGGVGCLVAAVGFDLAGIAWSRHIANRALRVSSTKPVA